MKAMLSVVPAVLLLLACGLLVVLAIEVVGAMSRKGGWATWSIWVGVGSGAVAVAASGRDVPLSVAVLLLALSLLLWRQRRRIRRAAERGLRW